MGYDKLRFGLNASKPMCLGIRFGYYYLLTCEVVRTRICITQTIVEKRLDRQNMNT